MDMRGICSRFGAEFLGGVSIAPFTSFKIGGICDIVKVNKVTTLLEILRFCKKESVPFRVLGRGSNVLISDKGLDGVVLLIGDAFGKITVDGEIITCQAGAKLSNICKTAAEHSLAGIEFAYGIPGSTGGAVYMNAGAYGGEMAHVIESCEYIDVASDDWILKQIDVNQLNLSYRHSIFCDHDWVITKVKIRLEKGEESAIRARMADVSAKRCEKQPLEFPSAGSTFKRPDGYFAAKLIDDCGLRGKTVGGAAVSEKHAGFVINKGGATFDDVNRLIAFIQKEVFDKTGITLEREIEVWA